MNRGILKCMFTLNGTSLRTKSIIYFIFDFHSRRFVKIAFINIVMVIFTKILEMHCLNCDGTKWRICMNTNININIWATSLMR